LHRSAAALAGRVAAEEVAVLLERGADKGEAEGAAINEDGRLVRSHGREGAADERDGRVRRGLLCHVGCFSSARIEPVFGVEKSKHGSETPKVDLELIERRLRIARIKHENRDD